MWAEGLWCFLFWFLQYVGSENINRKRGDAEAARYCIPTLRVSTSTSLDLYQYLLLQGLCWCPFYPSLLAAFTIYYTINLFVLFLQIASKNMGAHKPKAVLGLSLKGISLYDERSKVCYRIAQINNDVITVLKIDTIFFHFSLLHTLSFSLWLVYQWRRLPMSVMILRTYVILVS